MPRLENKYKRSTQHLSCRQHSHGKRQVIKRSAFNLSLNIFWTMHCLFHVTCEKSQQTGRCPVFTATCTLTQLAIYNQISED